MKQRRAIAMVALFVGGCAAGAGTAEDGIEQEDRATVEAALDANSGKTVWAVTEQSLNPYEIIGLDRYGSVYVRAPYQEAVFKYDPYGKLVWQRSLTNPAASWSHVEAAVVDPDGNVFFAGDQRVNPDDVAIEHFLAKLGADGAIVFWRTWNRAEGTAVRPKQIVIDESRYIWVIGTAVGNADLGGGQPLTGGENEGVRPYLAKYTLWGELLFAQTGPVTMRNVAQETSYSAITPAVGGGVFLTGYTRRWWDLGCGMIYPTSPAPDADYYGTAYLAKLDFNGYCTMQHVFGHEVAPSAIAVSTDGRVAIGGTYRGTIDFGGKSLLNGTASPDVFLSTFDAATGNVGWVKRGSGTATLSVRGIAFDHAGYLDVVGTMLAPAGTTNRTFTLGTFSTAMDGEAWRTFVGRFTPKTGATAWVRAYGDDVIAHQGIAVSSADRVMLAGEFIGTTDLGKGLVGTAGKRHRFLMRVYP